jgi:hypothetical protein
MKRRRQQPQTLKDPRLDGFRGAAASAYEGGVGVGYLVTWVDDNWTPRGHGFRKGGDVASERVFWRLVRTRASSDGLPHIDEGSTVDSDELRNWLDGRFALNERQAFQLTWLDRAEAGGVWLMYGAD